MLSLFARFKIKYYIAIIANYLPHIKGLENYPGNKYSLGVYQTIINNIPPHKTYIEPFVGSGAIALIKRPADLTVINDIDSGVIDKWNCMISDNFKILCSPAEKLLSSLITADKDTFVYMDPPYPLNSRFSKKKIYKSEMTLNDHKQLLSMVLTAKFNCMISSYPNDLYDITLKAWRKVKYNCRVHQNTATEILYCNFPEPTVLHDYSFIGYDCWDRQRIKRKIHRHVQKLLYLPAVERNAILTELLKLK